MIDVENVFNENKTYVWPFLDIDVVTVYHKVNVNAIRRKSNNRKDKQYFRLDEKRQGVNNKLN